MKTIGKLKLSTLNQTQLNKNELNRLKGGSRCCICGCPGGSSPSTDNGSGMLNSGSSGSYSPGGGIGSGSYA